MFSLGADDCCLGSQLIVRQGPCGAGFFASVLTGVFFWWMWRWRRLLGWWLLALWLFLAFAGEIFAWVCSIANGYTWLLPVAACRWLGAGGALLRFIVSMIGGTGWGFSLSQSLNVGLLELDALELYAVWVGCASVVNDGGFVAAYMFGALDDTRIDEFDGDLL